MKLKGYAMQVTRHALFNMDFFVTKQDVIRTSSDELFKRESTKTLMTNILFIYAREHGNLSYKQVRSHYENKMLLVSRVLI